MPAAIIGGVGAAAGGIASGKGASKAAKIQAQATVQQTAALQAMYATNKDLMTPTFDRGEAAQSRVQSLLGLSGGDGADAQAILAQTPGYQFAVRQGLAATNANAYASGSGNSGAALKALQDRGSGIATQNYNNYVGQLGDVANRGVSAMNGLVSQGNYTTGAINQQTQGNADSQSANAVFQGNNIANVIKGISGSAASAFGSSYGNVGKPLDTAMLGQGSAYTQRPIGLLTSGWGGAI
jgi:hypothetical protein